MAIVPDWTSLAFGFSFLTGLPAVFLPSLSFKQLLLLPFKIQTWPCLFLAEKPPMVFALLIHTFKAFHIWLQPAFSLCPFPNLHTIPPALQKACGLNQLLSNIILWHMTLYTYIHTKVSHVIHSELFSGSVTGSSNWFDDSKLCLKNSGPNSSNYLDSFVKNTHISQPLFLLFPVWNIAPSFIYSISQSKLLQGPAELYLLCEIAPEFHPYVSLTITPSHYSLSLRFFWALLCFRLSYIWISCVSGWLAP